MKPKPFALLLKVLPGEKAFSFLERNMVIKGNFEIRKPSTEINTFNTHFGKSKTCI